MRIISKYKDYYDNAMAYGIDTTQVFVRNEEFVEIALTHETKYLDREYRYWGGASFELTCQTEDSMLLEIEHIPLGFCGEMVLGTMFKATRNKQVLWSESYYGEEQIIRKLEQLKGEYKIVERHTQSSSIESLVKRNYERNKARANTLGNSKLFKSWFITFNTPTFSFAPERSAKDKFQKKYGHEYHPYGKHILQLHPCLRDLDFYRYLDAFNCYQRVNQYRFGVLANNEDGHSQQSDLQKVQSHGFDMKYGFRTRPKKK